MKSILYVGATLMIGASIYGFVDYKKTSHKKEFTSMYEEEKKTTPVVTIEDKITEPAVTKEVKSTDKKSVAKKQVVGKKEIEAIAAIRPIPEDEKIATTTTKEIEKPAVDVKTSKDSGVEKKVTKKKKLNARIFSRAPLREEINLVELPKETVKKTENKER